MTQSTQAVSLTPRLQKAINVAAVAHDGHKRKGTSIPYVSHLFGVMYLLAQVTDDEDVLIAGLLHDALEDVPERYGEEQLRADFGDRVLAIVQGVTKDSSLPDWQARSDAYIEHLATQASEESVMLSCADKLHNLQSILLDYEVLGDELWSRFNSGKERQQWWYEQIAEVVEKRLPGFPLNRELQEAVTTLKAL